MSCTNCSIHNKLKISKSGILYGEGCSVISHEKRSVVDWLSQIDDYAISPAYEGLYEVSFKNGRKEFYRYDKNKRFDTGTIVVVEGNPGYDVGIISVSGDLVRLQMRKKRVQPDSENIKKILRKASPRDIEIWQKARDREENTQREARIIIRKLGLSMKLSDVEFQGDGKKATFYYTAESRVDFRQLIRELAAVFRIRVEMKQVDYRHEASRLGGIGSCGRELCCSTWMGSMQKVNTQAARHQQLSINPQKLQGQCGRLKCCLNYELETYKDALKHFPDTNITLKTEKGNAKFIKLDAFKGLLWYAYESGEDNKWYKLELDRVNEIIDLNKNGQKIASLDEWEQTEFEEKLLFEDATGEESLTRFDKPKRRRKSRNKRRKPGNRRSDTKNKNQNRRKKN